MASAYADIVTDGMRAWIVQQVYPVADQLVQLQDFRREADSIMKEQATNAEHAAARIADLEAKLEGVGKENESLRKKSDALQRIIEEVRRLY